MSDIDLETAQNKIQQQIDYVDGLILATMNKLNQAKSREQIKDLQAELADYRIRVFDLTNKLWSISLGEND
jgi:peptidoglycan hydrolase CwlO-like protein